MSNSRYASVAGWLAAIPLAALLSLLGDWFERGAVVAAALMMMVAIARPDNRALLSRCSALLLLGCSLSLAWHLLRDDFHYNYVWLYSGPELAGFLKIANLWGGDEGTLLTLASWLSILAVRTQRYAGWSGPGTLGLATVFAVGAVCWNPFAPTPPEALAALANRGMNVHLMTFWMALHPPLVLAAYALILAPAGAALQALAHGTGAWATLAARYSRVGWLILSIGLAAGMAWAYEDFSFGQFWHWDPVQTSVFAVWALVTASQHGLRHYRTAGFGSAAQPGLALLAAVAVLVSMLITRNATLASSHRYIGDTSEPLFALVACVLLLATALAWCYGRAARRRAGQRKRRLSERQQLLRIALALLSVTAAIAIWQLGVAYASAWLELPRPASLKPFFETLARWSDPAELETLRFAFDRWDVDNFALNAALAPLGLLIGLAGGYAFTPLAKRWQRITLTLVVGGLTLLAASYRLPLERFYQGTGMTSHHTVDIFYWLNCMLLAAGFLTLAALAWIGRAWLSAPARRFYSYALPIGLIHLGAMVALMGGLSATVLDTYTQQAFEFPKDFGQTRRFADGYAASIRVEDESLAADGGRSADGTAFQALGTVELFREQSDRLILIGSGNTLYRDARAPYTGKGPVRQLCEILDYRYARYAAGASYRLDPFIDRGFWRDVQVWLPPLDYQPDSNGKPELAASTVTVVIKTYPLLSWLWIGLGLTLLGAVMRTVAHFRVPLSR